ncbi:hypothetical protein MNBD_GAMMA10-1203 [hydrothermal vent metagenome]|uniref:Uncharacterized protein n=1 Tax=hydrothermal vent metagenome TaxID=652676 RepID=A0A3B0XZ25_9ZZZZ
MLIIRNDQLKAFSRIKLNKFEEKMYVHAKKHFSDEFYGLESKNLIEVSSKAIEKGKLYGFHTQKHVFYFLSLMFLLGSDFDSDVQLPWVYNYLTDQSVSSVDQRMENTWRAAIVFISRIAGDQLEFIRPVFYKLYKFNTQNLLHLTEDNFEKEINCFLLELYPEKYNYQMGGGNSALIKYGLNISEKYNVESSHGKAVIIVLMFVFGSGFYSDPLFYKISNVLNSGTLDENNRINKLLKQIRKYLEAVLITGECKDGF